jgi:hypothetical protein
MADAHCTRGPYPSNTRIVGDKFCRAQRLCVLAWLDADLVKAGELVALTALKPALTFARAGNKRSGRRGCRFSHASQRIEAARVHLSPFPTPTEMP